MWSFRSAVGQVIKLVFALAIAPSLIGCGGGDGGNAEIPRRAAGVARAQSVGTPSPAGVGFVVESMTLQSSKRISRTVWEYGYGLTVVNGGLTASDVAMNLGGPGPGTTLMNGAVDVGDLPAGASVFVPNAVTIRHDRTYPFSTQSWTWAVTASRRVLSSTTQPTAKPIILPGVITVDLSQVPNLAATTATVQQAVDQGANLIAAGSSEEFGASFIDATSITIEVAAEPQSPVPVEVNLMPQLAAAMPGQSVVVYAIVTTGSVGDGQDSLAGLTKGALDTTSGVLSASVEPHHFEQGAPDRYTATLKIGLAGFSSTGSANGSVTGVGATDRRAIPLVPGRRTHAPLISAEHGYTGTLPPIPCPLKGGCIETSRFNELRVLKDRGSSSLEKRPHYGVDLSAAVGTPIYVPAGGKVSRVFSKADFDSFTNPPYTPQARDFLNGTNKTHVNNRKIKVSASELPIYANRKGGITVSIRFGTGAGAYTLRFIHLSDVAVRVGDTTADDPTRPFAWTGDSSR
jgi:hypothetical protein